MSDELRELQRRLEEATAAAPPPAAELDAETRELREGWLALGQLLEAAHPAGETPVVLPPMPRRSAGRRWKLAAVAALAASLVVVATLAWMLRETGQKGQIASPEVKQPAPTVAQKEGEVEQLDWDDTLDDHIAMAGRELVLCIQEDWRHVDETFSPLNEGLQEIRQEIEDSTL